MDVNRERSARLIGTILVEADLITPEQLDDALAMQEREGGLLGEIAVSHFGVSRVALAGVLAEQWAEIEGRPATQTHRVVSVRPQQPAEEPSPRRIGEVFVEMGLVNEQQLEEALAVQADTGEKLGEILVAQQAISRLELADALSEHWSSMQKLRRPGTGAAESSEVVLPVLRPPRVRPRTPTDAVIDLERRVDELERAAGGYQDAREAISHLEDIRASNEAVAALRVEFERLSVRHTDALRRLEDENTELRESLAAATDALAQIDASSASACEEHAALERRLQSVAEELRARGEATDRRFDDRTRQLEERLTAQVAADIGERSLDVLADELRARCDAIDRAIHERTREVYERIEGVDSRLTQLDAALGHVQGVVRARDRLDATETAVERLRGLAEDLATQLTEIGSHPRQLDDRAAWAELIDDVAARLDALSVRVDGWPEARSSEAEVERRLDVLGAGVAEAQREVTAVATRIGDAEDNMQSDHAATSVRLDDTEAVLERLAAELVRRVEEVEAIATRVDRRLDEIGGTAAGERYRSAKSGKKRQKRKNRKKGMSR